VYEGLTIYLDRYTIDLTLYVSHVGPRGDASSDIYVNCPGEQHSQKLAMQRQRDCALIFHVMCDESGHTRFPLLYLDHVNLLTLAQARLSPAQDLLRLAHFCSP